VFLEVNHTWTSTGSSGGLTPVQIYIPPTNSVLYCQHSTLASTQSYSLQTAQSSAGPWFTEASTSLSTAVAALVALRVSGPFIWARPYLHSASTGDYVFRLVGVS